MFYLIFHATLITKLNWQLSFMRAELLEGRRKAGAQVARWLPLCCRTISRVGWMDIHSYPTRSRIWAKFLMMLVRKFPLASSSVSFALTSTSFHFTDFVYCCCCCCWFCCPSPVTRNFMLNHYQGENCGRELGAGNLNALKIKSDFMNIDWLLLPWMKIRFCATFLRSVAASPLRLHLYLAAHPVPGLGLLSLYCLAWIFYSPASFLPFFGKLN